METTRAAELMRYADGVTFDAYPDGVIVRSHGKAMGYLKDGQFVYVDTFWAEVYRVFLDREEIEDSENESQYRDRIAAELTDAGWEVAVEVFTRLGRPDIVATREAETILIETKLSSHKNALSHALGQLLFYRSLYPEAALYIAVPGEVNPEVIDILSLHGVQIYER